eukprot:9103873-Pyramimonas_sp.AAC.2
MKGKRDGGRGGERRGEEEEWGGGIWRGKKEKGLEGEGAPARSESNLAGNACSAEAAHRLKRRSIKEHHTD